MSASMFFDAADQPELDLNGQVLQPPGRYNDGTMMTAMFPARLDALRAALPDQTFEPTALAPGVGVVGISCFEYRDTDIGPYNGLAISILLNQPYFCINLPGRALVAGSRRCQFDGWVHHLPVTSEIACTDYRSGPQFLAAIDFTTDPDRRTCRLAEGPDHILTLSAATIPTPRSGELQLFSQHWTDGQPRASEFKINAYAMGESFSPDAATLMLGDQHPIARELAALLVQRQPLCYQYVARFEALLYGPEYPPAALRQRALTTVPVPEYV